MDRARLAALFAALVLAGGAWWLWRGRPAESCAGVDLPAGSGDATWSDRVSDFFAPVVEPVQSLVGSASSVVEDIVQAVTPGPWTPPARAAPYLTAIYAAEDAAGAPRNLFARQIKQESNFNPHAVNRRSGAKGLAQFMDATWAEWGEGADVFDPFASIAVMGRYMRWLYGRHGDWKLALVAYNWGTGNVQRKGLAAAPAETVAYVIDISGAIGLA